MPRTKANPKRCDGRHIRLIMNRISRQPLTSQPTTVSQPLQSAHNIILSQVCLHDLCNNQNIWDRICWECSGSGVEYLTKASRHLRESTLQTPAFHFISGRDANGFEVPWHDPTNTLACRSNLMGWNAHHFRLRSDDDWKTVTADDRAQMAECAAMRMASLDMILPAAHYSYSYDNPHLYGTIARPPTACSDYNDTAHYSYHLPNPARSCTSDSPPPWFPPEAHQCSAAARKRRLQATEDESSEDAS